MIAHPQNHPFLVSSSALEILPLLNKTGLTDTYFKFTVPANRTTGSLSINLKRNPTTTNWTFRGKVGSNGTEKTSSIGTILFINVAAGSDVYLRLQPNTDNDGASTNSMLFSVRLANVNSTAVPLKPIGFAVTPQNTGVQLDWDDPNNTTITGYQYKLDSGSWTNIANSDADTVTHSLSSLTNGTEYSVKIRAVNANGNSPESDSLSFTPSSTATDYWSNWQTTPEAWMSYLVADSNADTPGGFVKHGK